MSAFNVVRFRVKAGRQQAFEDLHKQLEAMPGGKRFVVIKTGEQDYCIVGEWDGMPSIVQARPQMISNLDRMRDMLEDLGGGLGLTDPVSGVAVVDTWG